MVGRDGWLFYMGENTTADLLGDDRLSASELEEWQRSLERRWKWWRDRGAIYLFVLVPNKSTIYPEKLPALLQRQARSGKLDQFVDYLREHQSPVPMLDLRPALIHARATKEIYWKTDSHWNAEGLQVACDAIAAKLRNLGVSIDAADERPWTKVERVAREGDCVRLLRLHGVWPPEMASRIRLQYPSDLQTSVTSLSAIGDPLAFQRGSGHGRTVLLCDSFFRLGGLPADANGQVPLLLDFHRFVSIWAWSGEANRADVHMLTEIAEKENPNVVIEDWTERFLRTPPPKI